MGLVYELFCKGLKEDPELQWDRIVDDMHAKDPWEDLRGAKHNGLRVKSAASFWECINFHKLMGSFFIFISEPKPKPFSFQHVTIANLLERCVS